MAEMNLARLPANPQEDWLPGEKNFYSAVPKPTYVMTAY